MTYEKKKPSPTVNLLPKTNINSMEKKMQRKTKILLYLHNNWEKKKKDCLEGCVLSTSTSLPLYLWPIPLHSL